MDKTLPPNACNAIRTCRCVLAPSRPDDAKAHVFVSDGLSLKGQMEARTRARRALDFDSRPVCVRDHLGD